MLPLAPNTPVAMTDHIDRSVDKIRIRGRVGFMHSWISDAKEDRAFGHVFRALHVFAARRFVFCFQVDTRQHSNLKWKVPGLHEHGLILLFQK